MTIQCITRADHSNLSIKMILTGVCDKKLIHNVILPVQILIHSLCLILNINIKTMHPVYRCVSNVLGKLFNS